MSRYERRKAEGRCVRCGIREARAERVLCDVCTDKLSPKPGTGRLAYLMTAKRRDVERCKCGLMLPCICLAIHAYALGRVHADQG